MKHWEIEYKDEYLRIEWNGSATFNLQTPIGGEWVDYYCFTCYGVNTEHEAINHAMEVVREGGHEYELYNDQRYYSRPGDDSYHRWVNLHHAAIRINQATSK